MPVDFSDTLVIGVASRALFDLELENRVFEQQGLDAFIKYQLEHEDELLQPGTAFHLVRELLALNVPGQHRRVEVMIMSRNHPYVYLRVSNSIRAHSLDITRAILTGGSPLERYIRTHKVDLLLSASEEDIRVALADGLAAARTYPAPRSFSLLPNQVRIALDGDCVLFSDEAERVNMKDGLAAFHDHERIKARIPLEDGPFAKFVRTLSRMQAAEPEKSPFRIGLVTARNAPAHERALRTLMAWGVRIDECAFLGGLPKDGWLIAFQPHIFFDDSSVHCDPASRVVPTAQVPMAVRVELSQMSLGEVSGGKAEFVLICRGFLGKNAKQDVARLERWYSDSVDRLPTEAITAFIGEFKESVASTPTGDERPSRGPENLKGDKLMAFLNRLVAKHTTR